MQSSYEVIKRALYFKSPDRLPMIFQEYSNSDVHYVNWNQIGTGDRTKAHTLDEWGCTWSRSEVSNMGLVNGHPLADWNCLSDYVFPDPDDPKLLEGMEQRFEGSEGKYIMTDIFALLFERMHHLHGFENTLADLYLEPERMEFLADKIVDFDVRLIENINRKFPGKIHGFSFTDDWGTERAAFISTQLFDQFFKPRYEKIFDACKKAGWDIWMHSCGKINELIPSLIDAGVNAFNLLQPNTNGIEELGRRFAGKTAFYTCCDIQTTLVSGTKEQIWSEAKQLMDYWGTENGGFICSDYGDSEAIGSEPIKKQWMYEAFLTQDRWKK
ncbi:MAG: uroporphyrinogen decarboxylase family protein [Massiliimalia sp.]